jgi:PAS domain S-box-containing protein
MGTIININDRIHQLFGYTSRDLIGQNVSIMMSSFFGERHDKWMKDYFKRGGDHTIFDNGARVFWVKDNSGYLRECCMDARVVPDLINGIRLIGVIYKNEIGPEVYALQAAEAMYSTINDFRIGPDTGRNIDTESQGEISIG